jgi:hypothetical protein
MGPVLTRGRVTQPGRRVSVGEAPFGGHPAEHAGVYGCGTLAAGWSASVGSAGERRREGSRLRSVLQTAAHTANTDRGEVCSACLWLGSAGLSWVAPCGTGTVPCGDACEWACIHMRALSVENAQLSTLPMCESNLLRICIVYLKGYIVTGVTRRVRWWWYVKGIIYLEV